MNAPLSVSSLNEQIKNLLEATFVHLYVEGELSRITYHSSGHIYFTLKDASSAISCVMFRGNASKLRFRLEEGVKVILEGAITLYKPRGSYQINVFMIEPSGHGALALAFKQLKEKLRAKGYFDQSIKKEIPKYPKSIALVTSASGAALQDMIRVASSRWPIVRLYVYDTIVQGENAAASIVRSLLIADRREHDIIVVSRGGGSIEDLWAFNEEPVADALYNLKTPVVSAVGHEIDWVITDYIADARAATPSAAMEIILPDQNETMMYLDSISSQLQTLTLQKIHQCREQTENLQGAFKRHSIEQKIKSKFDEIEQYKERFVQTVSHKLDSAAQRVSPMIINFHHQINVNLQQKASMVLHIQQSLESQNPRFKIKKGFVQISKDGRVIDLSQLKKGDLFETMDDKYIVKAKVNSIEKM